MARKKKEPTNEQMIGRQTIPSSTEADGTRQIIKESNDRHDFESRTDEEGQQKKNVFEEGLEDKERGEDKKTDFQPSPGRLETVDERFEVLDVEAIQPFVLIPYYVAPTDLTYPVVAKTPLNYFCLDGWNLVEKAKDGGMISLKCYVEYFAEHSNEELAIRKVVLRERPRGGICCYAETVRNATSLRDILLASDIDLKVFQHGGSRKGAAFTTNRQENITKLISERLGKSVSTINQYINHGLYLTHETLNSLAEREADKDFLEAAQPNKRWKINNLRSQEVLDEEITHQISESMMGWYYEYTQNDKKIKPVWNQAVVESQDADHTEVVAPAPPLPQETSNSEVSIAPKISTETCDEPVPGTETSDEVGKSIEAFDENDSFETLKFSVETLAKNLLEASTVSDPTEYLERITAEAKNLSILVQKASVLRTKGVPFTGEVLQ